MKEIRTLNVMFAKSGSGGKTTRLTIPMKWIKDMDITEENRSVEVTYDENTKTISIIKK